LTDRLFGCRLSAQSRTDVPLPISHRVSYHGYTVWCNTSSVCERYFSTINNRRCRSVWPVDNTPVSHASFLHLKDFPETTKARTRWRDSNQYYSTSDVHNRAQIVQSTDDNTVQRKCLRTFSFRPTLCYFIMINLG